jgi:hypothetical protein
VLSLADLGAEEAKKLIPPDIEVACHYGRNICMLSGPDESMKKFVKVLQHQGIFTREVNCANIAHHSKHMFSVRPLLLKYLKKVIYVHCSESLIMKMWNWTSQVTVFKNGNWNELAIKLV